MTAPTPDQAAAQEDFAAFMAWAKDNLGQGYSLEMDEHTFVDKVTRWAYAAYRAARRELLARQVPDTERLEWLMRSLAGSTLRGLIGPASNTGDIDEFRRLIDTRRAQKYCDRCGYLFKRLRRTTAATKYRGCDVCDGCHAELEPNGLAAPTAAGAEEEKHG